MTDGINIVIIEDFFHAIDITDVHLLEDVPAAKLFIYASEIFRIPRVGQVIDINYSTRESCFLQQIMDEVAADKSAAAGDHQIINIHVTPFPSIITSISR
jgi:hypothetical protein